jgi:hypothetical protein
MYNKKIRGPLIEGNKTLGQITEEIINPLDVRPGLWWSIAFTIFQRQRFLVVMLFI